MAYTITEPHPTVPQNSYTHSGRGGLGNFFRAPATTSPSGVPTPATTSTTSSSSSRRFYSGRGGAGNAHAASERPVISFDEEYARAEVREKKAAGMSHVGRGGAGNIFFTSPSADEDGATLGRRDSASTQGSWRSSTSTVSSLAGFWGRVKSAGH
ncbi:hypothetical protein MYCTH_2314878 [Thermothelomyces thermophilus ATCC 42464]|uniref:Uncharacterized protein n=1 Tax=Thermothelomyces thermophilus (strain ATCC 42464 / BCRC 31852 / DSM 1799) TaxID=573729 RepID=G2Q817_THET4|nr:uncharacterized protein MYCTH_2314878 [Thermothelomyces thermophilus ATCC 42464]AEO56974.1 hypothetical protein MYCTH_2314878 [Thermothelomyces thermophilus ATCC 42464]